MTAARRASARASTAFFLAVVLFASWWGPAQRRQLSPPRALAAAGMAEARDAIEAAGVKGRTAVVFSRQPARGQDLRGDSKDVEILTDLMRRGVFREVVHVVPEESWLGVSRWLAAVSVYRATSFGRAAVFDEGRVSAGTLATFWPDEEFAVVLVDPGEWPPSELAAIERLVGGGRLRTDLVVVLRGGARDLAAWRAILPGAEP